MASNSPDAISADTIIRRSPDQVSSNVEGEVAIMSIEKGNYYMLNETGARFWSLIEEPTRIGQVCATLLDEFDATPNQCEAEILRLARELLEQNLIEVVNAAPA